LADDFWPSDSPASKLTRNQLLINVSKNSQLLCRLPIRLNRHLWGTLGLVKEDDDIYRVVL